MKIKKYALAITFAIDGIIAIGFGLFSWVYPQDTFGTILSIPDDHSSIFVSLFSSLSLFYILIGMMCLIGIRTNYPVKFWIVILMVLRHLLEGIIKLGDMEKDWFIGDPYPDLIIHSVFIVIYILLVCFRWDLIRKDFLKNKLSIQE